MIYAVSEPTSPLPAIVFYLAVNRISNLVSICESRMKDFVRVQISVFLVPVSITSTLSLVVDVIDFNSIMYHSFNDT